MAGKPEDVGEDQAAALFYAIDSEGTGSIPEAQFTEGMSERPPMGRPTGAGGMSMADLESLLSMTSETNDSSEI